MRVNATLVVVMVVMVAGTGPAVADRDLHAGLNYRSDLGTHQKRVEVGARWNTLEAGLVLDPSTAFGGTSDHDLIVSWWFKPEQFAAFSGWRNTSYRLLGEVVWHEKLLAGALGRLPSIGSDRLRFIIGFEVAVEVVRHGDAIYSEWFDASSMRAVNDLVNCSLFARAELALEI